MQAQGTNPSSASAGATQQCPICKMVENEPLHKCTLPTDIITEVVEPDGKTNKEKQESKRKSIFKFLKNINALLNRGHGLLCIHTAKPHLLGLFDQAVDRSMLSMIPDDTFFDDNFERNFYQDKNHVVFRVQQKKRPISTLSFHTKASTDTGLVDPNHGQMRNFLKRKMDDISESEPNVKYRFVQDEEVDVAVVEKTGVKKETVFQESLTIQAKNIAQWSGTPEELANYCFEKLSLQRYISAFSKQSKGGSVFLGVSERKTETKKWTEESSKNPIPSNIRTLLGKHNPCLKLYGDGEGVLHIASDTQVPTVTGQQTGVFDCQGVNIGGKPEQERFRVEFLHLADTKLCWFPSPSAPHAAQNIDKVQVRFHNVLPRSQPSVAHASSHPSVAHASSHPSGAHTSSQPSVAHARSHPSVAHARSQPSVAHASSQPSVAHTSSQPSVAHASSQPSVAHASSHPSGAHTSSQPIGGVVVVEIYVPKFQGVCFIDDSGPEAYEYQNETDTYAGDIVRLAKEKWIAKNRGTT